MDVVKQLESVERSGKVELYVRVFPWVDLNSFSGLEEVLRQKAQALGVIGCFFIPSYDTDSKEQTLRIGFGKTWGPDEMEDIVESYSPHLGRFDLHGEKVKIFTVKKERGEFFLEPVKENISAA